MCTWIFILIQRFKVFKEFLNLIPFPPTTSGSLTSWAHQNLNVLLRHAQLRRLCLKHEVSCDCFKCCSVLDWLCSWGSLAIVGWVIVGRWGSRHHQRLEDGCSESRIDADKTSEPHWRLLRRQEERVCKPWTQLETTQKRWIFLVLYIQVTC